MYDEPEAVVDEAIDLAQQLAVGDHAAG